MILPDRTFMPEETPHKRPRLNTPVKIPHYIVDEVRELGTTPAITLFLAEQGILESALKSFKELSYYVLDFKGVKKSFIAAACQNQKLGWQILNQHYNGCVGKEGITVFQSDPDRVMVFENQMDCLLLLTEESIHPPSVIILNSFALLSEGIQAAKAYRDIDLLFQPNPAGANRIGLFQNTIPYAKDCSIRLHQK